MVSDALKIIEDKIRSGAVSITPQDLAPLFQVEKRTVDNWEGRGLRMVRVGGQRFIEWVEIRRWVYSRSTPEPKPRRRKVKTSAQSKRILRRFGMLKGEEA